jgi:hypothetical protein
MSDVVVQESPQIVERTIMILGMSSSGR